MAAIYHCRGFLSPHGHGTKCLNSARSSCISIAWRRCSTNFAKKIPEFTVYDEDDDDSNCIEKDKRNHQNDDFDEFQNLRKKTKAKVSQTRSLKNTPIHSSHRDNEMKIVRRPGRVKRVKQSDRVTMADTSWMAKNAEFSKQDSNLSVGVDDDATGRIWQTKNKNKRDIGDTKTFRQDFRQTRVFVQGIPQGVSWQELKDHFRKAGNVVFASISIDTNTGKSKGQGIVQFETTAMAQNAITIMRDFPMNGSILFVREDVQQNENSKATLKSSQSIRASSKWKCANEDNTGYISEEELKAIKCLITERDDARKRRQYDVSDSLRDDLKTKYGVFIDDRLKMWWTSVDGRKVPQSIRDINGEGRWKMKPWRQIPTTPENDACINSDMVEGLLKQRDIARREKDFKTADMLLEQARTSPDGDLELRIHDESRTWRAWTKSQPPVGRPYEERHRPIPSDPAEAKAAAARESIEIVKEYAPAKLEEIITVLKRFPGREFQVLKRLKQKYL
eukprot:CAMPEP_0197185634 /NCGR_PEP_ID=MMETSP1423-20130617/12344_1 /TAXON_ID=476441 /ORGANISM="Pseudo-nitzschia heimii, Strain UNC1101" /LENGTH=504 /DNA_ID=CAMNT_0042636753 /DNA_START=46 /DNA_END=1560 /DNA_ORIENTATION=+